MRKSAKHFISLVELFKCYFSSNDLFYSSNNVSLHVLVSVFNMYFHHIVVVLNLEEKKEEKNLILHMLLCVVFICLFTMFYMVLHGV